MKAFFDYEILESGVVSIRFINPDGSFHREFRCPGDNITDLPILIRTAIREKWTPAFIIQWDLDLMNNTEEPELTAPTLRDYEDALQAKVDRVAQEKLYRDGVTLASYAMSQNPTYSAEARAFLDWRDSFWDYANTELAKALSEPPQRDVPTISEFLAEMPVIQWPEEEENG